jgi:nicotinamide riboside transporter PnuC
MIFIEQIQVHCWLFWVLFSCFVINLFAVQHLHLLIESSALLVASSILYKLLAFLCLH